MAVFTDVPARYLGDIRRPVELAPEQRKRTGLMPAAPESDHQIRIGGKTVIATVRPRAHAIDRSVVFVCMNPACAGKSWETSLAMRADHPAPSVMAAREEIHVYALWCNDPADPDAVEPAARALALAKAKRARVKEVDLMDPTVTQDRADAYLRAVGIADSELVSATKAHARAAAPIGLIAAPPEDDARTVEARLSEMEGRMGLKA